VVGGVAIGDGCSSGEGWQEDGEKAVVSRTESRRRVPLGGYRPTTVGGRPEEVVVVLRASGGGETERGAAFGGGRSCRKRGSRWW
jgi:hypothetical protein